MKIKKIEELGREDVYNMTVENHHNFAVNGGFLVHNCDAIRYFIAGRPKPNWAKKPEPHFNFDFERKQAEAKRGVTVTEDFFKGGWS